MGRYHLGMACLNGHPINSSADRFQESNAKFCRKCGEATISACQQCNAPIRGHYEVPGVISLGEPWKPDAHCHGCERPYPWTERSIQALTEAVELAAEDLSADERDALKDAIPDLIAETPRTQIAAARFKKAITKAGAFGGKLIADTASKLCVEVAKQYLGV